MDEEPTPLTIKSPYPNNTERFPGGREHDDSYPDIDFVEDETDKPIPLHTQVLGPVSGFVRNIVKCNKSNGSGGAAHTIKWPFNTHKMVDKHALAMVLRYCYGGELCVMPSMVCPVVAALWRLEVRDAGDVCSRLCKFAVDVAQRDVVGGAGMLWQCVGYAECCSSQHTQLDVLLGKAVLTKHNMDEYFEDIVQGSLMHMIRSSQQSDSLLAEARQQMAQMKQQMDEMREQLAQMKQQTEAQRLLAWAHADQVRSVTTTIPTGHTDASGGGAVFDDARQNIISVSAGSNECRDVFVTHLESATRGKTACYRGLVPFSSANHAPVFDNDKFVYFMEYHDQYGNGGRRFGRVDVVTWTFEELPELPEPMFEQTFSGCWHNGMVYAVDSSNQLCAFDPARRTWARCGVTVPKGRVRLLSNPHDVHHIFVTGYNPGMSRIDLATRSVSLVTRELCVYGSDQVLVGRDETTFVVISVSGEVWSMYNSTTGACTKLAGWKQSKDPVDRDYVVVRAPSLASFYYHIHKTGTWEAVPLP